LQRYDGVAGVVLAAQQALEVQEVERFLDAAQRLLGFAGGLRVAFGGELEVEAGLFERLLLLAPGGQGGVQQRTLAQQALRSFAVVPEIRRRCLRVELLDTRLPFGEVKDTSRTMSGVPRGSGSAPSAR